MNETFAKVLQFSILFWLFLSLFAMVFSDRIENYFLDDSATTNLKSGNTIGIFWNIMTFQVTTEVPIWMTIILDMIAILTVLAVIMAIFDR